MGSQYMKRSNRIYFVLLLAAAAVLSTGGYLGGAAGQQPAFVYLYARVTDHVNLDMSESRLRHIVSTLESYRQAHPDTHATATILFSGAVSQALEDRNPQTHIVDYVKDYIRRGVIEAGYDGTDEPTYDVRPTLKFTGAQSPDDRWKLRQSIAEKFLSEARDPLTGAPAAGTGGLKEMQAVFGTARYLRGTELAVEDYRPPPRVVAPKDNPAVPLQPGTSLKPTFGIYREIGGDTETIQMMRPYNAAPIMFGIPSANPAQLPGYRVGYAHFGMLMSPAENTAPELYWQDYVLRVSEAAPPVRGVKAVEGVEAVKGIFEKADRKRVQVLQLELDGIENYLRPEFAHTAPNPPLRYAYSHPQAPKLPADTLVPPAETSAAWAKEDALLQWLADDFFHNNAGSRFISNADLSKMAGTGTGFSVSVPHLENAVNDALKKFDTDTFLFNYLKVDDQYLSLAELFQVMTDALAEYQKTGQLPQSVKAVKVYGPYRVVTGHGPNIGELTAGDIERTCADIAPVLHDDTAAGVPKNSVPPLLRINGMVLNPAQMIRLMGLALANPAPETKLAVRMKFMLEEAGAILPKTRNVFDVGFVWTLKPAPLTLN
jgi:hypothetical protein